MKILFVLPELYPQPGGGLATYYLNYIPKIKPYCDEIKIIVGSASDLDRESVIWEGIEISYLKSVLHKKYIPLFTHFSSWPEIQNYLATAWALYEQAGDVKNYDIIETTDWYWNYIPFALNGYTNLITRLHGSPAQIEYYDPRDHFGLFSHFARVVECDTLNRVSHLLTHSINNQKFWENALDRKINHLYPIITLQDQEIIEIKDIPLCPYALVVGRIQAWKGAEILCQALKETDIGIPIYWIGRDTPYKKINSSYSNYLANKYPGVWGKKIIPIGSRTSIECKAWMSKAEFGIVPSTWDMFNLTIIEWILTNKPVVCSKGAGGYTLLKNCSKNNSLLAEAENGALLLAAIKEAKHLSLEEKDRCVIAQLENYKHLCGVDELIKGNLELYDSIIKVKADSQKAVGWKYEAYFPNSSNTIRTAQLDQWSIKELIIHLIPRVIAKFKIKR